MEWTPSAGETAGLLKARNKCRRIQVKIVIVVVYVTYYALSVRLGDVESGLGYVW